jgi:hypothetical protein
VSERGREGERDRGIEGVKDLGGGLVLASLVLSGPALLCRAGAGGGREGERERDMA